MISSTIKSLTAASLFVLSLGMVDTASAASCGPDGFGFDTMDIKITIGGDDVFSTDCALGNSVNDDGNNGTLITDLNAGTYGGDFAPLTDDWSFFGKSDSTSPDGVTAQNGQIDGTFNIDFSPDAYSVFAASFKASTGFVVYLFDLRPDLVQTVDGMFSLELLNKGGNIAALSHLSVATWGEPTECPDFPFCDPVTDVPVPASLPLLAAGMGIVGIIARRRKRATA